MMSANEKTYTINFTDEERDILIERAHARGYRNPKAYLLELIEMDVEESDEEESESEILMGIQISLEQALTGKTFPASQLWQALEAADDE
jgi:hypothetical protein